MIRNFLLLAMFLVLVACGKSNGQGGAENSVQMAEISVDDVVPSAALNFDVQLEMTNFSARQEAKLMEAAELIKQVVSSEKFKNAILKHKFNGKRTFVDNNGLTNAQIYKKILEGSEKLRPGKDNTMNLTLVVYQATNNVVGYTYPSELKVWMNAKYLNANSPADVTTNMVHEWLHKLGFGHEQRATPSRKYSVPYAVGYLVARLAKKL